MQPLLLPMIYQASDWLLISGPSTSKDLRDFPQFGKLSFLYNIMSLSTLTTHYYDYKDRKMVSMRTFHKLGEIHEFFKINDSETDC